jgi:hypothetical protein
MSFQIDLDQIEVEDRPIGPLPKGTYNCIVEECSLVETKNGGQRVKVTYQVIEGDNKNSKIWDSLMVVHGNPKVVKIGLEGIKRLANAVGIQGKIADPSELAGTNSIVAVTVDIRKDAEYGDSNVVKRVAGGAVDASTPVQSHPAVSSDEAPF